MPAWTWLGWELMPEHAKEVTPVVFGMMAPSLWQGNRGVYLVEVPDLLFVAGLPDTKFRDPVRVGYARFFSELTDSGCTRTLTGLHRALDELHTSDRMLEDQDFTTGAHVAEEDRSGFSLHWRCERKRIRL